MQKLIEQEQTIIRKSENIDKYEEAFKKVEAELGDVINKYTFTWSEFTSNWFKEIISVFEKHGLKIIKTYHHDSIGQYTTEATAIVHEKTGQFFEKIITLYKKDPKIYNIVSPIHQKILNGIYQQKDYTGDDFYTLVKKISKLKGIPDYLCYYYVQHKMQGVYVKFEKSAKIDKLTKAYEKFEKNERLPMPLFGVDNLSKKYGLTPANSITKIFRENVSSMFVFSMILNHEKSGQFFKVSFEPSMEFTSETFGIK